MDATTTLMTGEAITTSVTGETAYCRGQVQDAARTAVVLHRGETSCFMVSQSWMISHLC